MRDTFTQAFQIASKLSPQDREALGALLLQELQSDERWSQLFASSQDLLSKLADEALAEHKAGKTKLWQ